MITHVNRRGFVGGSLVAGTLLMERSARVAAAQSTPAAAEAPTGPFTLPDLPYSYEALEPHIDTLTMQIHHDKHHAAYVTNLNKALVEAPDLTGSTIEELLTSLDTLPEAIQGAVRNQGGGHFNHILFWEAMSPSATSPAADLLTAIDQDLGGLEALTTAMTEAGMKRFGSGWSWLVSNGGTLSVLSTPNQDNPIMDGSGVPLLGVDVWEHAYYLLYQNKRADYLATWWNVVNWDVVATRYSAAN